ncbi:HD domain-containing protein [candidate division KSB1 bacterium]|nr:HD domain-containing protein [candidate division KSB1 bacterium]
MEINHSQKLFFKHWFEKYTSGVTSGDSQVRQNLDLKKYHTYRVCEEIVQLSKALGKTPQQQNFAFVCALFHDVGRFEQYAKFGTYKDRDGLNHAQLSLEVLDRFGLMNNFAPQAQTALKKAILYHNLPCLPQDADKNARHWAGLLRDADKLDIWQIAIDFYRNGKTKNAALDLGLPDDPVVSPLVLADLENRRIVDSRNVRSLDDLKLLLAGWVYDINFNETLVLIRRRGYLESLHSSLAHHTHLDPYFERINDYIETKLLS